MEGMDKVIKEMNSNVMTCGWRNNINGCDAYFMVTIQNKSK